MKATKDNISRARELFTERDKLNGSISDLNASIVSSVDRVRGRWNEFSISNHDDGSGWHARMVYGPKPELVLEFILAECQKHLQAVNEQIEAL